MGERPQHWWNQQEGTRNPYHDRRARPSRFVNGYPEGWSKEAWELYTGQPVNKPNENEPIVVGNWPALKQNKVPTEAGD